MKLVASMPVGVGEAGRYLAEAVPALLEFCDEVCVRVEGDAEADLLAGLGGRVVQLRAAARPEVEGVATFDHEGRARQQLLDHTLLRDPTHVLAVDADEFVSDGIAVRAACEARGDVWTLTMREVWEIDGDCLCVREDGGWRPHPVPILWRVTGAPMRIADRALACGREPAQVRGRPAFGPVCDVLHFGWACRAERQARYDRYAAADGGRFHASQHLDSIMWPDDRVQLAGIPWPAALAARRAAVAAAAR